MLPPRLTPDSTRSGRRFGIRWLTASSTQSVGVPSTAKRRVEMRRTCSGRRRVSEWPAPLCSISGATTQTSRESARATFSNTLRPGALMPSSLVTRMRARARSSGASSMGGDHLRSAPGGHERGRQRDRAVGLRIVLDQGDHGAADGETGTVERVDEARAFFVGLAEARLHAPRLEIAAVGAAGDLAILPLPR